MKNLLILIIIFLGLSCALTARAGIIIKPVFNTGLVGYWDFQEGAGANVYDKSGQGNHGTWNGTAGLFDENFEANPGYDMGSYWTEEVYAGCSIDPDNTDVPPPPGGGSYIAKFIKGSGVDNHGASLLYYGWEPWRQKIYFTGYFRIASIDDGGAITIWRVDESAPNYLKNYLYITRSGSTYEFHFSINGEIDDAHPFNLNQWYKIAVEIDAAGKTWGWKINDTEHVNFGSYTSPGFLGAIRMSMGAAQWASLYAATVYIDLIKGSATGWDEGYWADGKIGEAGSFNGRDDYVSMGDNLDMIGTSGITLSAWVKANTFKDWGPIIDKLVSYGNYRFFTWATGTVELGIRNAAGTYENVTTTTILNTGQWYHLVATFDDSTTGKIYIDGSLDKIKTDFTVVRGDTDAQLRIGYTFNNLVYFDGLIDEVRIYNRVLDSSEVSRLYKLSQPKMLAAPKNGLVGYWSFNEGTGTKVGDMSGNGSTGTWNGAGSHWADGKFGKAGSFNGSDDYLNIGTSSELQPSALTVAAWVKRTTSWNNGNGKTFVWAKGDSWSGNGWYFESWDGAGDHEAVSLMVDGANYIHINEYPDDVFPLNQWVHIAATFDSSTDTGSIYVNGVARSIDIYGSPSAITSAGTEKRIGIRSTLDNALNGLIDEVRIYNRDLDPAEITALYNSGLAKINASQNNQITNGLVGLWSFNGSDIESPNADLLKEGFEARPGYDTAGWSETTTGGTVNEDSTAVSRPSGGGNQSLRIQKTSGASVFAGYNFGSDKPDIWTTFYYRNDANNLANEDYDYQFTFLDFEFNSTILMRLYKNGSGELKLVTLVYKSTADGFVEIIYPTSGSISQATWYKIGFKYDTTNHEYDVQVNDASIGSGVLGTGHRTGVQYVYVGSDYNYAKDWTSYYDLFKVSSSKWPDHDFVIDRSGQGNNGTIYGPTPVGGKVGQALSFNGTSDYIAIPYSASLDISGDHTISAWVYLNASNPTSQTIFIKQWNYNFWFGAGGNLRFSDDNTHYIDTVQNTWSAGQWYHLVGVFDDSFSTSKIYVNGNSVSVTQTGDWSPVLGHAGSIGNRQYETAGYLNGRIDEVRIYNRALTAQEILRLYNMGH